MKGLSIQVSVSEATGSQCRVWRSSVLWEDLCGLKTNQVAALTGRGVIFPVSQRERAMVHNVRMYRLWQQAMFMSVKGISGLKPTASVT